MYIYEVQFDFMQKNHQKHSNGENRRFYYVNLAPKARNHEKSLFAPPTETQITLFFDNVCYTLGSINGKNRSKAFRICLGLVDFDDFDPLRKVQS